MARKKFSADYTAGDILSLYASRKDEGDESRIRALAKTFRELCRLEHKVEIPKQYEAITRQVRTPFVRDTWHRITSSIVAKPPVAHCTPKDEKDRVYRHAANVAERFDMAMLERLNKEVGTDMVYEAAAALVRDGESVIKIVHRPEAWANFPERGSDQSADDYTRDVKLYARGAKFPIAWRVVDRLCMVYEGGEYGDNWVIEYGEYTKAYLKNRYRMNLDAMQSTPMMIEGKGYPESLSPSSLDRMVKIEFFTPYEWHVLINGTEANGFPKANPYNPHLPYYRATAFEMESLLYSLMFLVPRLDELLTMKLNWSVLGAYPNPIIETVPNVTNMPMLDLPWGGGPTDARGNERITWSPGKAIELPVGKKMSFLSPPPVGKDLNDLVVIFKSLIDIAGVPAVMRGMGSPGDSGYLASQLRASAEMSYRLATLALQRQLEQAIEFTHWLVPNVIKQPVYVLGWDANNKAGRRAKDARDEWLALVADEKDESNTAALVDRLGPISMQYRPTLPTDEQARAMIALQLTNAAKPLYDRGTALENWLQEEDPEGILDAIYVEQALEQEPLATMVRERALREAGLLPEQQPQPASSGLVDQYGNPMMLPGPSQLSPTGIPPNPGEMPGMPGQPGLNMPIQPPAPVPGQGGSRPAGMYPGMPGGPNMQ